MLKISLLLTFLSSLLCMSAYSGEHAGEPLVRDLRCRPTKILGKLRLDPGFRLTEIKSGLVTKGRGFSALNGQTSIQDDQITFTFRVTDPEFHSFKEKKILMSLHDLNRLQDGEVRKIPAKRYHYEGDLDFIALRSVERLECRIL
jgi:hypothetical protein